MHLHMEVLYFVLMILFLMYVFTIYTLLKKWEQLAEWAKAFYLVLLFTGIGPIPILFMLSLNVGIE